MTLTVLGHLNLVNRAERCGQASSYLPLVFHSKGSRRAGRRALPAA
jgi:hypothetical protein